MQSTTSPYPFYADKDGSPLDNGSIYLGVPGQDPLTNPVSVYWDAAGTIPAAQPIKTTNGFTVRAGSPAIVYTAGDYSITIKNRNGSLVAYVRNSADFSGAAGFQSQIGTLNGRVDTLTQQVSAASVFTVVAGDGVSDRSAELASANAAGRPIAIKGVLRINAATTITVPIVDTMAQLFTTTSQITIDNGLPVRPEWFGSTVYRAAKSLPQPKGGVVVLRDATYGAHGFNYTGSFWDIDNVSIVGARQPRIANDCRALTGGSIIQGAFINYANNVSLSDLGIDAGYTFTQANGGSATDALACTYGTMALRTAQSTRRGLRLHNVVGLVNGPTDAFHAVIANEGFVGTQITGTLTGCYGVHGVVFKGKGVYGGAQINAYLNTSDGVIIKSDQYVTDNSIDIQIGDINAYLDGPDGSSPYIVPAAGTSIGVFVHAYAANISKIKTGAINERGHAYGMKWQWDNSYVIDNVQMGDITVEGNSAFGVDIETLLVNATCQRCQIGDIVARNSPIGVVFVWQNESGLKVGSITAVNCSTSAVAFSGIADPVIDSVIAENCGAVYQVTGTRMPRLGASVIRGSTFSTYTAVGSGQVPTLAAGWGQVSGGENFDCVPGNYGVTLKGLVAPGSGATNLVTTLPQALRPSQDLNRLALGLTTANVQAAVPVVIKANGQVLVNPSAGGITNVGNWLSLDVDYEVLP